VFTRLKRDDNTPGEACRFRKHGDYRFPAGMTRRSVLIPDNHGSEYVVSHSKRQFRRRRLRPKARRLNGIEEMPPSRRTQDARVGYVAIMVCDVLTHLMTVMLKEHRVPTTIRPRVVKSQNFSLLPKPMKLRFYTRLRQTKQSFNWSTPRSVWSLPPTLLL
jgi:hypothetical protein